MASSDMFPPTMQQPSYSNITETDYDDQQNIQGIYGTQAKQATSTVGKSMTHPTKSSGSLFEEQTMGDSLQNIFMPIGGGGARPVKDPFLSRYSPTDSDDNDKLLDMDDEHLDDISQDFSINEDSLLMPDDTQKNQQPVKLSSSKGHPVKIIKSSTKSMQISRKSAVSSSDYLTTKDTSKNVTSTRKEYATRLSIHGVLETTVDMSIATATKRSVQSLIQGNL